MTGRGPVVIAGRGRIHVSAGVVGTRVEVAVELKNVGLRRGLEKIAAVVEYEEVACAWHPGRNPLGMARSADLFVASGGSCPILLDGRRVALAVARRIAEAIQEVPVRTGGQRDAGRRIAGHERVAVINDVELASRRVNDNLVEVRVIINRVAVQPVVGDRPARQIQIQPPRVIGNAFAHTDVIGFARVEVLNAVVKETPLPHHAPGHVHLHNGVHLGVRVRAIGGIAARRHTGIGGNGLRRDIERGIGAELRIVNAQEVMVQRVVGARFRVLPDGVAAPVHFLEPGEAADIAVGSVEDITAIEEMRIRPDWPRLYHAPLQVDQVGVAPRAEEGVAGIRARLVPIQHLGRSLQSLVGGQRGGTQDQPNGGCDEA